jgi:tetratricopeptide (TPR) repeat protein
MVLALAAGLLASPAAAREPRAAFAAANDAYRAGRYDEAARTYRGLVSAGQTTPAAFFNLGNALLKSQRTAEALWAYLNARALSPGDPDVRANLEHAVSLLPEAARVSWRPSVVIRWLAAGGRWTTRALATAWILCLWAGCAAWVARGWWWPGNRIVQRAASAAGAAAGIVLVILAAQTAGIDAVPQAVVIAPEASVRFAPQPTGTLHFTLPGGAVVRVLQQQHGWTQVRRGDGRAGWVPDETLARLLRGAML